MARPTKEGFETLILCVDRDDDLGVKAKIKTPILGRKENLNAAIGLALRDPEDPDSNAIFEAVRVYDRLREEAEAQGKCEIATIAGSELGGVGADKKLVSELTEVLKVFPASDVVLVTDGYSDEVVLPLVQSRVPVTSVRRIVIKHSESIEETAALLSRYFKTISQNPRYSRIALGLPGLLLIVLGFLYLFRLLTYAGVAFLIILGSFLFVKGFRLDEMARNLYNWMYSPPPMPRQIAGFSIVTGALLIGVGFYQGWYLASLHMAQFGSPPIDFGELIAMLPMLLAEFISGSIDLVVFGVCTLLSGRAIRLYFERNSKLLRTVAVIVVLAWSPQIFRQASEIIKKPASGWLVLAISILFGMLLAVVTFLITLYIRRRYSDFFREKEEEEEEKVEGFPQG